MPPSSTCPPCDDPRRVAYPDSQGEPMKALQLTAWKHDPEMREVADPEPGQVVGASVAPEPAYSDLHVMHDFDAGALPWGPPFGSSCLSGWGGPAAGRLHHLRRVGHRSPELGRPG